MEKYGCPLCENTFSRRSNVLKHCLNVHKKNIASRNFRCHLCNHNRASFVYLRQLRLHCVKVHGYEDKMLEMNFLSMIDFESWKSEEERNSASLYVTSTGVKRFGGKEKYYYVCNRSGIMRPSESKGTRKLKSQGSCKINHYCFSSMDVVKKYNGEITVSYRPNHFGHSLDVAHLPLSKEQKIEIAEKLAEGVGMQRVLDEVRSSTKEDLSRVHIISKRDLRNILKSYNIDYKEKQPENDKNDSDRQNLQEIVVSKAERVLEMLKSTDYDEKKLDEYNDMFNEMLIDSSKEQTDTLSFNAVCDKPTTSSENKFSNTMFYEKNEKSTLLKTTVIKIQTS